MRAGFIAILIIIVGAAVVAFNSLFIVNPTQQALVLQFGEVRQAIRDPGLNMKIPVVQNVVFLDKRVLDLNVPAQEIIASDQKRLVVDAFMRYRIADPLRFYQATQGGSMLQGNNLLSTQVASALRNVLADATFTQIVRDDRPQLMQRIANRVAASSSQLGVEVVDVKIRRADLPEANSEAIFARMQTEREQEAREIRAQGQEAAQRVRASADRTATVLRAEANRESEQIRGQGDARRNAIFANAFGQDPQFFAFYRAMQAYEQAFASDDTRLVLSPDADFFRYFNDPFGAGGGGSPSLGSAPLAATPAAAPAVRAPAPLGDGASVPSPADVLGTQSSLGDDAAAAQEALDADVATAEQEAAAVDQRERRDAAAAEAEAEAVAATNPSIGSGAAAPLSPTTDVSVPPSASDTAAAPAAGDAATSASTAPAPASDATPAATEAAAAPAATDANATDTSATGTGTTDASTTDASTASGSASDAAASDTTATDAGTTTTSPASSNDETAAAAPAPATTDTTAAASTPATTDTAAPTLQQDVETAVTDAENAVDNAAAAVEGEAQRLQNEAIDAAAGTNSAATNSASGSDTTTQ